MCVCVCVCFVCVREPRYIDGEDTQNLKNIECSIINEPHNAGIRIQYFDLESLPIEK